MKRFLLSCFLFFAVISGYSQACDLKLSNLKLTVNSITGSGPYIAKFDLEFYIDNNGGNKQIYVDLWKALDYTAGSGEYNWTANSSKMPLLSQMDGSTNSSGPLAVIGFEVNGKDATQTATFVPYYSGDNSNINYTNKKLIKGSNVTVTYISNSSDPNYKKTKFVASGLELSLTYPAISLKGNIWGSQTQLGNIGANPTIHCYDDLFDVTFGEVVIASGSLNCVANPRTFQLFMNVESVNPINVSYQIFVDLDGDFKVSTNDPVAYTSSSFSISDINSSAPDYSSGNLQIANVYGTDPQYQKKGLIAVVYYKSGITDVNVVEHLDNTCATLPVTFTSFNAVRRNKNVELKWETASEENNKGFYVQRNTGGEWKSVAFVFSAAANGNSSTSLSYAYNDPNSLKGVSQYRILQVDIDGKGKYSEIRSVRGEEQAAKVVVFPNPSAGKLNVMFEDALSVRDIQVMDIAGRMVRQYLSVTSNSITIDNLRDGFYNIQVTDRHTGVSTVEKAVVKKR